MSNFNMCWQDIFLCVAESYIYLEFVAMNSLIFLCDLPKYFFGPEVFCNGKLRHEFLLSWAILQNLERTTTSMMECSTSVEVVIQMSFI